MTPGNHVNNVKHSRSYYDGRKHLENDAHQVNMDVMVRFQVALHNGSYFKVGDESKKEIAVKYLNAKCYRSKNNAPELST